MKYLLQNCNAGYIGNSPCFWHKTDSGYTQWIDDAKQFKLEEATAIMRSTKGTHTWRLWRLDDIERSAKQTVDIQDLDKIGSVKI